MSDLTSGAVAVVPSSSLYQQILGAIDPETERDFRCACDDCACHCVCLCHCGIPEPKEYSDGRETVAARPAQSVFL